MRVYEEKRGGRDETLTDPIALFPPGPAFSGRALTSSRRQEKFMLMNEAVTCLAFSRDADMLASASTDGQIKVCVCAEREPGAASTFLTHALVRSFAGVENGHGPVLAAL